MTLTKPCAAAIDTLLCAACTHAPDFQAGRMADDLRMRGAESRAARDAAATERR